MEQIAGCGMSHVSCRTSSGRVYTISLTKFSSLHLLQYIGLMVIIIVLEVTAAILGFVFREQLVSHSPILMSTYMVFSFPFPIQTEVVEMRIDEAIMSYSADNPTADVNGLIDFVQNQVQCVCVCVCMYANGR